MKGDFTRNTFDASKHFTRVLMQQGRVQLDADWNEQAAILLHYLQVLAADLIGPHGGPADNLGFGISVDPTTPAGDFLIGEGDYYVNGILCENEVPTTYTSQPEYPLPEDAKLKPPPAAQSYLVYLDVWERHITYIEDDSIREVALGGPDTATRAKVVRQAKVLPIESDPLDLTLVQIQTHTPAEQRVLLQVILLVLIAKLKSATGAQTLLKAKIDAFKQALTALNKASLRARAYVAQPSTDPCTIQPDARYRGAENQLYRVEIHRGGAWDKAPNTKANAATFKWSRENGSVVFPIRLEGKIVTLTHLGRDSCFGLAVGDWVEIVDDDYVLQNRAEPLLKVQAIDPINLRVTLDAAPASNKVGQDPDKHPLLRRWDHKAGELTLDGGAALIVEAEDDKDGWLTLEDGVQIQFQKPKSASELNQYRTGDYWLIPARTATGDVEWPGPADNPEAVPPHGVEHHYAPLASISVDTLGKVTVVSKPSYRRIIRQLWDPEP